MFLSFHGGVRDVTGSCHLLEIGKKKLLIDCGMFQGEGMCGEQNFEEFDFDPTSLDAVIVTHAHYDHIGRLPLLVKRGFKGPIYTTPPTKALARIILEDGFHVMSLHAKECEIDPLYSSSHLDEALSLMKAVNYHTQFAPVDGALAMFHDAGHILGSAFVTIDAEGKRVVFSGDLGNEDVPILPATEDLEFADAIVTETTYGDREHDSVETRKKDILEMVDAVIGNGGTLIIPAFSLERTQELLYELDELVDAGKMPDVPIYLDSPLAIKATLIYRDFKHYLRFDRSTESSPDHDFFSFPKLKETLTRDASKAINEDRRSKIIIAGSGMMTGGRVLHHLKRYLDDEKNGVLIIGYQAENTLGRRIQEGSPTVTIDGQSIEVKAKVKKMNSFSAHADKNKLAKWLKPKNGDAEKIILVHGDPEVKKQFKQFVGTSVSSEVIIPEFHDRIEL